MRKYLLLLALTSCDLISNRIVDRTNKKMEEKDSNAILAEIDNEKITVKQFKEKLPGDQLSFEAKYAILDELISQIVIKQIAQAAHITVLEEEIDQKILSQYKEETSLDKIREQHSSKWPALRESMKLEIIMDKIRAKFPKIEDSQIDKLYDNIMKSNPKLCVSGEKVRMSHILIQDKAKIDEVKNLIEKNPGKFADFAKTYSVAPEATKGGDLGFFERTELIPAFDIYFEQNIGFISPPIPSEYGTHFIKVTGKMKASGQPDRSCVIVVKAQIRRDILDKKWVEWLDDEIKRRKIAKNTVLLKEL